MGTQHLNLSPMKNAKWLQWLSGIMKRDWLLPLSSYHGSSRSVFPAQSLHSNHHIEASEKIYFALLLYSYAMHLRQGSYRSLPLSRSTHTSSHITSHTAYDALADEEDEEIEDFYRVPLRSPSAPNHRRGTSGNVSISSFADFVSAPGRMPRKKNNFGSISSMRDRGIDEEDILFDEDEVTYAASTSSHTTHSKLGTDGSTIASDEERGNGTFGSDSGKSKPTGIAQGTH